MFDDVLWFRAFLAFVGGIAQGLRVWLRWVSLLSNGFACFSHGFVR